MRIQDGINIVILLLLVVITYQLMKPSDDSAAKELDTKVIKQLETIQTKLSEVEAGQEEVKTQIAERQKDDVVTEELDKLFTNKTPQSADTEKKLNDIKAKFEGLFVNFQYLNGCGAARDDDYHLLNSALIHELASSDAPARLQYDILTAAQGTYDEIYARSECPEEDVQEIENNFNVYIEEMQKIRFVIAQ